MSKIRSIDGVPVEDARHALTIEVLPRDITKSTRKEPDSCAMAIACRRQLHAREVLVHLSRVYVKQLKRNLWLRYAVPQSLRVEVIAFDRGGGFAPGVFTLSPCSTSKKLGKRQGSAAFRRGNGKKRQPRRVIDGVRSGPTSGRE